MRPPRFADCAPADALARLELHPSRARERLMRAYFGLAEPFTPVALYKAATMDGQQTSVSATYRFIRTLAECGVLEAVPTTSAQGLWRSAPEPAQRGTGAPNRHAKTIDASSRLAQGASL
ncbi:MAG: hypothetical protein P8Z69_08765 [Acidihalobacter sp.]